MTATEGAADEDATKISAGSNSASTNTEHVFSPAVSNLFVNASSTTSAIANQNIFNTFTIYDSDDEEITVTYTGSHFPGLISSGAVPKGLVKRENDRISANIAYADVLVNKKKHSVK